MSDNFKITDMEQENIDTKTSYTKDDQKIENITLPTIPTPDYSYGNSQDSIDWWLWVRNIWSRHFVWSFINWSITLIVPFKPRTISCITYGDWIWIAYFSSWAWGISDTWVITQNCTYNSESAPSTVYWWNNANLLWTWLWNFTITSFNDNSVTISWTASSTYSIIISA